MVWMYTGFIFLILILLALDLGVFHRKAHVVSIREALLWSVFWITLGLLFSVFIHFGYDNHWLGLGLTTDTMTVAPQEVAGTGLVYNDGSSATIKYITGYVVEKSLAVDNIFVIAMIFAFLRVPAIYQHRVLFWGILGAILMRGAVIAAGTTLIREFAWILYVFGAFLIFTGIRMFFINEEEEDPSNNVAIRVARRLFPITEDFHGSHFFLRAGSVKSEEPAFPGAPVKTDRVVESAAPGTLLATPLFLALVVVEVSDVIFAVDSIPAIFAITTDPFLVFTSNVMAILGLRSLYFALASMLDRFRFLKVALSIVLVIVGVKMLTHVWLKKLLGEHFNFYLLGIVLGILAMGIAASLAIKPKASPRNPSEGAGTP
ncbi:MAG: TerC family protein [Thermoanaerobaculia bacterium]|nr:TerC family protein [Thermoanaerobaculia bacterium]